MQIADGKDYPLIYYFLFTDGAVPYPAAEIDDFG